MERKPAAILSADVQGYSRLMGEDVPVAVRLHPFDARYPEVGTVGKQTEELPFSGEPLACVCSVGNEGNALIWQMGHPALMVIRQHHIAWRQS